jgi:hypothetical protein
MTALRGDQLDPGTQLDLVSNVLTASANNRQTIVAETVIGGLYS